MFPKIPQYSRIVLEVQDRIARGEWKTGEALPNRNLLCKEFGTTRVTLDKAILQLVQSGVLTSAKGSGTYVAPPESAAKRQSHKRTALQIGVILGSQTPEDAGSDDVYFGPVLRGIMAGLAHRQVQAHYAHLSADDYLNFFREGSLNGLLVVSPPLADHAALRLMFEENVPFVAVSTSVSPSESCNFACVDAANAEGGASAARHLTALGHTRIACVNLALSHANHVDRMRGFQNALAEAGLPADPDLTLLGSVYDVNRWDSDLDAWLKGLRHKGKLPTAIFACDCRMTLETLAALRRAGLAIPQDVSVVGFDDFLSAGLLTPPLTLVRQPVQAIGRRAAQRLLESLKNPGEHSPLLGTEHLETELIVRGSTRAL
jgi:DNA-binding LacI/PurR family transcriptional regulator